MVAIDAYLIMALSRNDQLRLDSSGRAGAHGQAILDARAAHSNATLADLYDPNSTPANVRKAHRENDRAVDRLYRRNPFESERERVEHLFMLYERLRFPIIGDIK